MPNPVSSEGGAQFDVIEVDGDGRLLSDPGTGTDALAVGAEPSQGALRLRRTMERVGSARVRLGIGVVLLGVLGVVSAAGTTSRVTFPRPAARPPVVYGCPSGKHCAVRVDAASAVAAALETADPASSPQAETTYDTGTGRAYRTEVTGNNGGRQYRIESSCQPGGPAAVPRPIRTRHIDSSGALPGFGGYTAVSVTRVRDTSCVVHIEAVAPDEAAAAIRAGTSSWALRAGGGSFAAAVLLALLDDPRIWLGR